MSTRNRSCSWGEASPRSSDAHAYGSLFPSITVGFLEVDVTHLRKHVCTPVLLRAPFDAVIIFELNLLILTMLIHSNYPSQNFGIKYTRLWSAAKTASSPKLLDARAYGRQSLTSQYLRARQRLAGIRRMNRLGATASLRVVALAS